MWNRVVLSALLFIVDRCQLSSQSVGREVRTPEETNTTNRRSTPTTEDVRSPAFGAGEETTTSDGSVGVTRGDVGLGRYLERGRVFRGEKSENRIVGGEVIDITESPSTVRLKIKTEITRTNLCGGNLLSHWYVLTAAHCVTEDVGYDPPSYTIVKPENVMMHTGTSHLNTGGDSNYAEAIWVHPEFMHYYPVELYRDVAVVKLRYEVKYGKTSRPAVLYRPRMTNETMAGTVCKVAGWGLTHYKGSASRELRQVTVTLRSPEFCEKLLNNEVDLEVHVCASDDGRDTCRGDSGGGLFCDGRLLAVTSWGYGCASRVPAVYARTDTALDFIDKIINGAERATLPLSPNHFLVPLLVSAAALQ